MRIIRKTTICVILLCIATILFACGSDFHTANISLYEVELSEVQAHCGAAYYLSKDGTLYSTGADSDTASFVSYQNSSKGIVAENVKCFGEYVGGGYYVDLENNLYMWNEDALPLFGYFEEEKHQKILDNVNFASSSGSSLIYVDMNFDLYLIGLFAEEMYSIEKPKLLAKDVICADINNNGVVLWANNKGHIGFYGNINSSIIEELNVQFADSHIMDIGLEKDYIAILSNSQLWYYGDYDKLVSGKASQITGLTMLKKDVLRISCSINTIMALDAGGSAFLWGRCVSNDGQNTESVQFEFVENF